MQLLSHKTGQLILSNPQKTSLNEYYHMVSYQAKNKEDSTCPRFNFITNSVSIGTNDIQSDTEKALFFSH